MCKEQFAMTADMKQTASRVRRNGMGNIFDGIDPALFSRLGLGDGTEEVKCQSQDETQVSNSCFSDILEGEFSRYQHHKSRGACWDQLEILGCLGDSCCGESLGQFRPRSFSCSLQMDMCNSLAQRRRRNALADLFSTLSPTQRSDLLALAASVSPALPPTPTSPSLAPEPVLQVTCS